MKLKTLSLLSILLIVLTVSLFGTSTITTWVKDMYNQPSIKPQEQEGMKQFPINVVAKDGTVYSDKKQPFQTTEVNFSNYESPENSINDYQFNEATGKQMFLTYCAVCHGPQGKLNDGKGTRVSQKGLKVIAIRDLPKGYYYERLHRGGVQMPPLSYRMTDRERWDIANYIKLVLHKN